MKNCGICGKEISGKGPKKYCLACSKIAYKLHQNEWRAKHSYYKGPDMELMKCERCGKEMTRKNSKQKYCIKCGNIVNRGGTRDRAREKAKLRNNG